MSEAFHYLTKHRAVKTCKQTEKVSAKPDGAFGAK